MEYRRLGSTGLEVSAVSFGALAMGRLTQKEASALVDRALEAGMNYIDTARAYGESEIRLGNALRGRREKVILSTKGIKRELKAFQADYKESLGNLQTDYTDIFFIHDVSTQANWDAVQSQGILDFLQEEKRQGRIRHLACSTHDCVIGAKMLETGLFQVCMLAYNPSNTEVEGSLLPMALERDMGVVIMKPFGGGVLTEARSADLGFSITAQEALRFAVCKAGVSTVIPGLDKPEYLETALRVAEGDLTMGEAEREEIMEKVSIRGKNYCRGCGYCLPCPMDIPIPTVLSLYNRWEVFGGVDWARMHQITTEHTGAVPRDKTAENCIACGACTQRCPYNLPIPELMGKAAGSLRRYD